MKQGSNAEGEGGGAPGAADGDIHSYTMGIHASPSLVQSMSAALGAAALALAPNLDVLSDGELVAATKGFAITRLLVLDRIHWLPDVPITTTTATGSSSSSSRMCQLPIATAQDGSIDPLTPQGHDRPIISNVASASAAVEDVLVGLSSMLREALPSRRPDLALGEAEVDDLRLAHWCCMALSCPSGRQMSSRALLDIHPDILTSGWWIKQIVLT